MTPRLATALGWCLALAAGAIVALAQPIGAPPATAPAQGAMRVTITGVEGMVQVRDDAAGPWRKAAVGMVVTEGAEFRTGPRSAVRCLIPPDQTITLDRLGVIKLLQALRDGNVVRTRVGMPYGRTRYDIEEAGIEHRSELVSPSSTLAIRGTRVSIYDQPPYAPAAVSLTGTAEYRTAGRQVAFGAKGAGKTEISSDDDSAAATALRQTYVDPTSPFGRPAADQQLILNLQARADSALGTRQLAAVPTAPSVDAQLSTLLAAQGRFNISLRWSGAGNFDLFVLGTDPKTQQPYTLGDPSYKGSIFKDTGVFGLGPGAPAVTVATSPDGGRGQFDPVNFAGGHLEFASFGGKNQPVPQQGYTIGVLYYDQRGRATDYPARSQFQVDAFLDGKRVPVITNLLEVSFRQQPALVFGPTYTGTASLVTAEQLLPSPVVPGDFRATTVDLTPDALGLDGKPLGNINPGTTTTTAATAAAARPVSGKTAAARPAAPASFSKPARPR